MIDQEQILFEQLKKEISKAFIYDFPSANPDISQWKGLDIIYFQEHLRQKVRGNVSEKWFYTYFKSPYQKLPRIDMLNLLAQYAGYRRGWTEFLEKNKTPTIVDEINEIIPKQDLNISKSVEEYNHSKVSDNNKSISTKNLNRKKIIYTIIGILCVIIIIFSIKKYYEYENTFHFCFYDTDRGSLVKNKLDVIIQKEGFSPEYYAVTNGCFSYRSTTDTLKMTINSPMYKKELFTIGLKQIRDKREGHRRSFSLRPDDYATMLYYYSTTVNSSDEKQKALLIKQRKEELNKLIADDALIYQVYDSELFGVEVLDKKKYIDFMTTPTTSLKNYVLISSQVNKNNKINLIKFKIQSDEN